MSLQNILQLNNLTSLFSVVMVLDRNLRILHASDVLLRHMPMVSEQPSLQQAFDMVRPRSIRCLEDVEKNLGSLFMLVASDKSFAIRGQMIAKVLEGQDYIVFCGAPWLSWLVSKQPDLKLGLADFPPQDVQLDQLFYMTTEKQMVKDLEVLNEQLQSAKETLEVVQDAKNAFFAQMSHEMRTPLNGVVAALGLMKEQPLSDGAKELLNLASKSSVNLMQVINYVLDIAKLESSVTRPEVLEFDLASMVTSVIDIVRARALEKGLELRTLIDRDLPASYKGDVARVRQALLNLAINAIKFTETGTVTLKVVQPQLDNQTLRFEVTDTGEGISEQDHERIFDPFVSNETSGLSKSQQNTGLGLDIAKRNVESMAGRIGLISVVGCGATFWVELPFPSVALPASAPCEVATDVDENATFTGRVLLVDDNETNLLLGTMILEKMGVTVTPASSGEEAVEIATSHSLELVFMDISMPGIDGFEATSQIREAIDGKSLPIVAFTAYASSAEMAKSESCGMNGYLTKPIEQEKLLVELEKWLPRLDCETPNFTAEPDIEDESARVDRVTLNTLLGQIGKDNFVSVLAKFDDEAGRRWSAMNNTKDKNVLAREAHTLASTCRSFGLPSVADKLNAIERHTRFGPVDGDEPPSMVEVGRELRQGLVELKAELAVL